MPELGRGHSQMPYIRTTAWKNYALQQFSRLPTQNVEFDSGGKNLNSRPKSHSAFFHMVLNSRNS